MPKGLHTFTDRTQINFQLERLPGYPERVPGHLLVSDVLARPEPRDLSLIIRIFGAAQVRSVLSQMIEKGRISPTAAKTVERQLPEDPMFKTL